MTRNEIDAIISALKTGISSGSTDYHSGFNDGAYTLYRYLFEPNSIPPEFFEKAKEILANKLQSK
jgi:hypothetical protein